MCKHLPSFVNLYSAFSFLNILHSLHFILRFVLASYGHVHNRSVIVIDADKRLTFCFKYSSACPKVSLPRHFIR